MGKTQTLPPSEGSRCEPDRPSPPHTHKHAHTHACAQTHRTLSAGPQRIASLKLPGMAPGPWEDAVSWGGPDEPLTNREAASRRAPAQGFEPSPWHPHPRTETLLPAPGTGPGAGTFLRTPRCQPRRVQDVSGAALGWWSRGSPHSLRMHPPTISPPARHEHVLLQCSKPVLLKKTNRQRRSSKKGPPPSESILTSHGCTSPSSCPAKPARQEGPTAQPMPARGPQAQGFSNCWVPWAPGSGHCLLETQDEKTQ